MGELIVLRERLDEQAGLRLDRGRPAFYFDLACPYCYLAAERVERMLGEADWIPVLGTLPSALRAAHAEERAAALRLPLVWPEHYPIAVHGAMRAATYAAEAGAGARFALAAFRLAFCGGYYLGKDEVLGELAAAAGLPREGCLEAAADDRRDATLELTTRGLRRRGVRELPAIRVEDRWFTGGRAIAAAAALRRDTELARRRARIAAPLAPPA
jgi:2-hydroxychromene-2-carboxylate isomerase